MTSGSAVGGGHCVLDVWSALDALTLLALVAALLLRIITPLHHAT